MTKYGRPSGVLPPSNTLAMAGWSISASACRSDSKRATTSLGVHPRLDDLERHLGADGLELLGEPDLAHPALADDRGGAGTGPMRLAGSPSPSAVTAFFRATVSSRPVVGRS